MLLVTFDVVGKSPISFSKAVQSVKGDKETHEDFDERTWREKMHVTADGEVPAFTGESLDDMMTSFNPVDLEQQESHMGLAFDAFDAVEYAQPEPAVMVAPTTTNNTVKLAAAIRQP